MRIYHSGSIGSNMFGDFKNKRQNVKKKYKSIDNIQQYVIQPKASIDEDQKKSKKQKRKILKKNIQFLEGLGLKVKQTQSQ